MFTTTSAGTTAGSSPRCNERGFRYNGACWILTNCCKKGHLSNICKTPTNRGTTTIEGWACYEFKEVGHIRKDCPKLKGQGGNSRSRVFVIWAKEFIQDPTVVTGMFLINNLYENILFNTGVDRSYITLEFRKLLTHSSSKLRVAHRVEMANDQVSSTQEILRNCNLTLDNHAFLVDLMPMVIGSFNTIIGMD